MLKEIHFMVFYWVRIEATGLDVEMQSNTIEMWQLDL